MLIPLSRAAVNKRGTLKRREIAEEEAAAGQESIMDPDVSFLNMENKNRCFLSERGK
ncbi:hypothetical protein J4Q44_G00375510 [Coregonus suidteri]|uniref:Uncharacterized protein n=1 Tax=Coregonus suidteri TaxID=861788 RepID=A0AAN8KMU2_9TELE